MVQCDSRGFSKVKIYNLNLLRMPCFSTQVCEMENEGMLQRSDNYVQHNKSEDSSNFQQLTSPPSLTERNGQEYVVSMNSSSWQCMVMIAWFMVLSHVFNLLQHLLPQAFFRRQSSKAIFCLRTVIKQDPDSSSAESKPVSFFMILHLFIKSFKRSCEVSKENPLQEKNNGISRPQFNQL